MPAKAVVFGGAGFLGSHVADQLSAQGYAVTIFDQRASGYLGDGQEMVVGDILDLEKVIEATKDAAYIYHYAGIADISQAAKCPVDTVKLNILGTTNILEAARQNKVNRFIFASSLYVYSDLGSFYRSSKQACELLIEDYQKKYDVPFTILRFGSLYGDRSNHSNFVHNAVKGALLKGHIEREGDGEEVRKYIHVHDAAQASVHVLDEQYCNQHIMITGHQEIKVKDMLSVIRALVGDEVTIEYKDAPEDEHYKTTPFSFSPRAAKNLYVENGLDLHSGLSQYIRTMHEQLKGKKGWMSTDDPLLQESEQNSST